MSSDSASSPAPVSQSPPSPEAPPPDSTSTNSPPPDSSSSSSSEESSPPPPPNSSDDSSSSSSSSSSNTTPSGDSSVLSPPNPVSSSSSSSSNNALVSSSSSSSSPPPSNNSPSLEVIIGVSVGVGLLFIIVIAVCITCCMKKKKRKKMQPGPHDMHFYPDPDAKHKAHYDSNYYQSSQQNWQGGNHTNQQQQQQQQQGGKWGMGPPGMSSEMSSGNYSGGPPYNQASMPPPSPGLSLGFNSNFFTYEDLANATGGFAQDNLLGQGGFGYVHKGVLPNGKEIAVKSLKSGSGQGEREFQAEVEIISRVHHRHLVSLVGYCMAGPQRMLVYEFVPNGTLEYHLHGRGRPVMDWETRLRIALGSAKGLAYLHEDCHPRIIHRDIKAANILLDNNFEAMVADFGLAKLSSDNNTHVSTRVMGTFGYLAPEYASSGKLTEKSDVFSFGVMLLELITGRRPVDNSIVTEDSLVDWARPLISGTLEEQKFDELVDARLQGNYNPQEMARMVACAGASIRHSGRKRPKMIQIVRALEGDMSLDALNDVPKSATTGGSTMFANPQYDTAMYNADMEKFRKVALSSQEFSSEYGGGSTASDRSI